jgi:hypothetical protein
MRPASAQVDDVLPRDPGFENVSFAAQCQDGLQHAFIVSLSALAVRDGTMDLYGTATLTGIRGQPDQSLAFNSGRVYSVTAAPEPASWAMLLAGMTLCAGVAKRRRLG